MILAIGYKLTANIMNVLMISRDKKILDKSSAVAERMIKYGRLCDQLIIIVFTVGQEERVQLSDNTWVYSTNSLSRFFCFWDAYQQASSYKLKAKSYLITVQDPFETALAGWLIKRKFSWPLQIQIHTDFLSLYFTRESWLNRVRVWLARRLLKKADGIRVVSLRIKQSLIDQLKIAEDKISVLPIYVDAHKITNYQSKIDLHQKYQADFIVLTMARLTKEKNIQLLINAFTDVAKECPSAKLIIVGTGPDKKTLELQAADYKLQDKVFFEDWTNDPISYYKTADLFVLSSNYEGYALSVVEAIVAGRPVVMTDVGCAGEVIKNNENSLVIPVGNRKALAEAIKKMITNSDLRQRLINEGRETAGQLMTEGEYLRECKQSWKHLLFE